MNKPLKSPLPPVITGNKLHYLKETTHMPVHCCMVDCVTLTLSPMPQPGEQTESIET